MVVDNQKFKVNCKKLSNNELWAPLQIVVEVAPQNETIQNIGENAQDSIVVNDGEGIISN
jgi:hypothetical protein